MLSRSQDSAKRIGDVISGHKVRKTYLAKVQGAFPCASFPDAVEVARGSAGEGWPSVTPRATVYGESGATLQRRYLQLQRLRSGAPVCRSHRTCRSQAWVRLSCCR